MNMKIYVDAVNAASARVSDIARQVEERLTANDTAGALALQPQLDAAKVEYDKTNALYLSVLNATNGGDDPAQRFIPASGRIEVLIDEADQPFEDDRQFFRAVKVAGMYPGREDARLRSRKIKDATGLEEGVPAGAGYLLPQTTSAGILEHMYDTNSILSRISIDPVEGNNMSYNAVYETTMVGSMYGGVVGYWVADGQSITASKPSFGQIELKLKDIAALCYATNDLLEDVTALASWLNRVVPNVLRFQVEDAIVEGNGTGKPVGIMNSPALVTVLRSDHTNIQLSDINRMWGARWRGLSDYVWLINPDVTPYLEGMTAATAPVYLPPGGMSAAPYGTLKGRPVLEVDYCKTACETGDMLLASLSQYQAITKSSGVNAASSIHVAFVTNETAFRFVYRIHGAPAWLSAVTPLHGTQMRSPFVTCSSASS
jgi:HK97 family phage major capsid protein